MLGLGEVGDYVFGLDLFFLVHEFDLVEDLLHFLFVSGDDADVEAELGELLAET